MLVAGCSNVRLWLKADIGRPCRDVCFTPNSGHWRCTLATPIWVPSKRSNLVIPAVRSPFRLARNVIHSDTEQRLRYDQSPTQEAPMTPSEYRVEKTATGLQYVIPGTERIVGPTLRAFKTDRTPAGDQLVIPGAERISTAEYVARLAI